jgi:hypothetical protein
MRPRRPAVESGWRTGRSELGSTHSPLERRTRTCCLWGGPNSGPGSRRTRHCAEPGIAHEPHPAIRHHREQPTGAPGVARREDHPAGAAAGRRAERSARSVRRQGQRPGRQCEVGLGRRRRRASPECGVVPGRRRAGSARRRHPRRCPRERRSCHLAGGERGQPCASRRHLRLEPARVARRRGVDARAGPLHGLRRRTVDDRGRRPRSGSSCRSCSPRCEPRRVLALLARRVVRPAREWKRAWLTPMRLAQAVHRAAAPDARTHG